MTKPPSTVAGVQESEVFWDRFVASANIHPANLYRYTLISDRVAESAHANGVIIDLGCGNGMLLQHLRNRKLGSRLVGFDGSQAIVNRNRDHLRFAEFHQADLQLPEAFPLRNAADVVICSEVVEHMPNYAPVFKIAYDCLRSGGLFILTTQGGKRRRHDIELLGHLRHYELNALADEVASAGFQVFHRQKAGWPALTAQKIAASLFMNQVAGELASDKEPSRLFRFACGVIGAGLKVSSRSMGPQLVIMGRKPAN